MQISTELKCNNKFAFAKFFNGYNRNRTAIEAKISTQFHLDWHSNSRDRNNTNSLYDRSWLSICVSVLRLIQRNFGAAAFKCFSGE